MAVRLNIVANFFGRGWSALMGLVFVPVYIGYLGIEAYGLIGFFAVLQAWMYLLDVGLTPALSREIAVYTSGAHTSKSIHDLFFSLMVVSTFISVSAGVLIFLGRDFISTTWLNPEKLSPETIRISVSIMSFIVALRLLEGMLQGALMGLQRQVILSATNAGLATLRYGGVILVLEFYRNSLDVFFYWQALISTMSFLWLLYLAYRSLPKLQRRPDFSWDALEGIRKFAVGMVGITLLSLLLVNADKIILSKFVSLEVYGYYMLATALAMAINQVIAPATQAVYPRMVELVSTKSIDPLVSLYHRAAQLVTLTISPFVLVGCVYSYEIVYAWSGDLGVAENVTPILRVLLLGAFFNGVMHMPYNLQLAYGQTKLTMQANFVAILVTIPSLLFFVPIFGAIAAAYIWLALNICYVLIVISLVHRTLLSSEKWRWYCHDLLLPVVGASVAVIVSAILFSPAQMDRLEISGFLILVFLFSILGSTLITNYYRSLVLNAVAGYWRSRRQSP